MLGQDRKTSFRFGVLIVILLICGGCGSDPEPPTGSGPPAQAPGVEGMKWLKKHGYVDEKGHPISTKQK